MDYCCNSSARDHNVVASEGFSRRGISRGSGAPVLHSVSTAAKPQDASSSKFEQLLAALLVQYNQDLQEVRREFTELYSEREPQSPNVSREMRARNSADAAGSKKDEAKMTDEENGKPAAEVSFVAVEDKDQVSPEDEHVAIRSSVQSVEAFLDEEPGDLQEPGDADKAEQPRPALQRFEVFLQSTTFDILISILLTLNVIFMAIQMQIDGLMLGYDLSIYDERAFSEQDWIVAKHVLNVIDLLFTVIFAIDVSVRIIFLRCKFWRHSMNWLDVAVVGFSLAVEFFSTSQSLVPMYLRLLRLGKLARALKMVYMSQALDSLQLLLKCLTASVAVLFWTFSLIVFIQCVAGMIIANLAREFLEDESQDLEKQRLVFAFFGTFSRTILTMFEILFANWSPSCRALVENYSEWYSLAFLFYRCVIGFAVLNVVNSVFVQQTMKVASIDESLAYNRKAKEQARYEQIVKKVFKRIDTSGDGYLSFNEFEEMLHVPKLQFWMSQLEIDYHDFLGLFELLDNGDGHVSLKEFHDSISRLKGHAKSIDVWRLEVKVEVLLSKLLRLHTGGGTVGEALREAGVHYQRSASNIRCNSHGRG